MTPDIRDALHEARTALTKARTREARDTIWYWIDTILDYANSLRR